MKKFGYACLVFLMTIVVLISPTGVYESRGGEVVFIAENNLAADSETSDDSTDVVRVFTAEIAGDYTVSGYMKLIRSGSAVTVLVSWDPFEYEGKINGDQVDVSNGGRSINLVFDPEMDRYTGTWQAKGGGKGTISGVLKDNDYWTEVEVEEHGPSSDQPYTYYTYLPSSIKTATAPFQYSLLVICPGSSGREVNNYAKSRKKISRNLSSYTKFAEKHKMILLSMATPRSDTCYGPMLTLDSFTTQDPYFQRPDLKLIAIIKEYIDHLNGKGIKVADKMSFLGFSAGGAFAVRFSMLHPEMVEKVAVGGQSGVTWPLRETEGRTLNFPLGVSDLEQLTGRAFKQNDFREIPFFIYIGDEDYRACGAPLCYPPDQWNLMVSMMGATNIERVTHFHNTLRSLGMKSQLKIFHGIGHDNNHKTKAAAFGFLVEDK